MELNCRNGHESVDIQAKETSPEQFERMTGHLGDHMGRPSRDRLAAQALPITSGVRHFVENPFHAFALTTKPAVPRGVVLAVWMGAFRRPDLMALQGLQPLLPIVSQEALIPADVTVPPHRQHGCGRYTLPGMRRHPFLDDRATLQGGQQDPRGAEVLHVPTGTYPVGGRADQSAVWRATLVADYRHRLGVQEAWGGEGHPPTHDPVPP